MNQPETKSLFPEREGILLSQIQALVTAPFSLQAPIDMMFSDISAELRRFGMISRFFMHAAPYPNPAFFRALTLLLKNSGLPSFILTMNAKSELVLGERNGRPLTIHDEWGIPLVAMLIDHPACHMEDLLRIPQNAIVTVIDPNHLKFLEDAGLATRTYVFCPHGGPQPVSDPLPMRERPTDMLFIGQINNPGSPDLWLDKHAGNDPLRRSALEEGYEAASNGSEVYDAVQDAFFTRSSGSKHWKPFKEKRSPS